MEDGRDIAVLRKGPYEARPCLGARDLAAALALRARCFRGGEDDRDAHDDLCEQVVIEDRRTGRIACTFRLLRLRDGGEIHRSYAARFYGLEALRAYPAPMLELGRFCIAPEQADADLLRVAWGALTRHVDAFGVGMLFGCSSFAGTDARRHREAFALLGRRHLAPVGWRPGVKAPEIVSLMDAEAAADPRRAASALPPLLRTYLAMGGWVSDHAVCDRDLGTFHVFTGLEVAAIPPSRARALRLVAG